MTNLDIVKMRVNEDFNDIKLENVQNVFPYWFENTLTVEPTDKEVLDNYNKKSMTEDELEDAKMEMMDTQREVMWGTLFEAKNKFVAEDIIDNSDAIISDAGFTIIDLSRENEGEYETGVFLGVNGMGYDFFDAHWIPLYKILGVIK
tara:strand:- start:43 stop:483 length:441 start_codon:yes stop_codon:yes gene_type:complete